MFYLLLILFVVLAVDDFDNSPISKLLFPSNSRSTSSVNFKLTIPEDQVVEREEVFVVLLDVIGAPAVSISRNCTIIRIQEQFFGKCESQLEEKKVARLRVMLWFYIPYDGFIMSIILVLVDLEQSFYHMVFQTVIGTKGMH